MGRITLLVIVSLGMLACKQYSGDSDVAFDQATIEQLRTGLNLSPTELKELCGKNSLLVYVGNGEAVGKLQFFDHLGANERNVIRNEFESGAKGFSNYVTKEVPLKLERAIRSNRGLCHNSAPNGSSFTIAFILDGHGPNNSTIITKRFVYDANSKNWNVSQSDTKNWKVIGNNFSAASAGEAFELNMPKHLPMIIGNVLRHKQIGADKIEQVTYIFKTHGGLVNKDPNLGPDLLNMQKDTQNTAHVFLFDPYGPNNEDLSATSGMFYYMWHKSNACRIAQAAGPAALKKVGCVGSTIPTAGTEGSNNTAGTEGSNNTAGTEGSNNTAGTEGSNNTAGTEGSNNTAGTEGSNNTAGTEGSNNTAGTEGSNNTAGTEGSNNTAGTEGSNNTANVGMGANTAGTGKGAISIFDMRMRIKNVKNPRNRPDAYLQIGHAISYDFAAFTTELKNLKSVNLLSLTPGSDTRLPSIVYLDSCYGSNQVLDSFKYTFDYLMKSAQFYGNKFIPSYFSRPDAFYGYAFSNPNPFYIKGLDYNHAPMDFFKIWPAALLWSDQPTVYQEFRKRHPGSNSNLKSVQNTVNGIKSHWQTNLSLYKVAKDEATRAGQTANAFAPRHTNVDLNKTLANMGIDSLKQEYNQLKPGAFAAFK